MTNMQKQTKNICTNYANKDICINHTNKTYLYKPYKRKKYFNKIQKNKKIFT